MTDTPENPEDALAPCPFCNSVNIMMGPIEATCVSCGGSADIEVWNTRSALSQKPLGGNAVDRYIPEFEKLMSVNPDTRARDLAAKLIPRLKAALTPAPDYVMVPRETLEGITSFFERMPKGIGRGAAGPIYCEIKGLLDAAPERTGDAE